MSFQRKLFLATAVCAITIPLAPQAFASPAEETMQESLQAPLPVSDNTSSNTPESVRSLDTVTVTATRQEESVLEVPATVDVVSRKEMDEHNVNNIADLVRYQPGIDVKKTTSGTDPFGNLTGYTIRGVGGNRVQMLVDGSRVIESIQDGNRDFVDLSMMKSVEMVRGPGSVLWGADALAGIVSYQSLDPQDLLKGRNVGARISAGYDSFNKGQTYSAMVAAQMTPTLQGIAGYTYRRYSEARFSNARADGGIWGCPRIGLGCDKLSPLDGNSNNVLAKLVWTPNVYHNVKITGESFISDADIKQLFDKGQVAAGLRNTGDYLRNQEQTRWRLGIEHQWIVDAGWLDELKWRLSYSPQKRSVTDDRVQTVVMTGVERATHRETEYAEDFLQADVQLTSRFQAGSTEHVLLYGFQGDTTKSTYDRLTTTTNLTTGVTTTNNGGGLDFADARTTRYDLFIQDEISFLDKKISVTPGLRWANYQIDPNIDQYYINVPGKEPQKISSHKLIPQISIAFKPNTEYTLYVRYAEGFKMPTVQQLYTSYPMATSSIIPNPDLKPETVQSFEIGLRRAFKQGWWSVSTYYNDYDDFIKGQQNIPGTTDYMSMNISKVKIWGIEASTGLELHRNWRLNAGISYMHGKERDDTNNEYNSFDGASPLNGYLGMQWLSPERMFSAELIGNFAGPVTRTVNSNKFKPSGYTTFDGYFNWNITKKVHLNFGVQNIFDKRYFNANASTVDRVPSSVANAYTMPLELYTGAGRTFSVNLNIDF
ncbi:MAG: TonB-dependent hemoglobin/transferrin/lactoferrin family receptor [Saezia sp.]